MTAHLGPLGPVRANKSQLLPPVHGLDRCLTLQRQASATLDLFVSYDDRQAAPSVTRGGPGVVLLAASGYVLGDAGVERVVALNGWIEFEPS